MYLATKYTRKEGDDQEAEAIMAGGVFQVSDEQQQVFPRRFIALLGDER